MHQKWPVAERQNSASSEGREKYLMPQALKKLLFLSERRRRLKRRLSEA